MKKLVNAFICIMETPYRLYGIPDYQMKILQRIFHIAARIVILPSSSRDITEILKDIHWLPVEQRIKCKILLLTLRAVNGNTPLYRSGLLKPCCPPEILDPLS